MQRIGHKMALVIALASNGPIARIDVARRVGPHGSLCCGYATVNRCIARGLVTTTTIPGRRGLAIVA